MKKLPAVVAVQVSLNDGLTILDLEPGNTMTLTQLRQIIKNNGFVSRDASLVARGTVSSDQKMFTVSGTNEQMALAAAPRRTGDEWEIKVGAPPKR
jgi:hypothetical protein